MSTDFNLDDDSYHRSIERISKIFGSSMLIVKRLCFHFICAYACIYTAQPVDAYFVVYLFLTYFGDFLSFSRCSVHSFLFLFFSFFFATPAKAQTVKQRVGSVSHMCVLFGDEFLAMYKSVYKKMRLVKYDTIHTETCIHAHS